jgi:hypothetical protein
MRQKCPVCSTEVDPEPRYPRHLCRMCAERTADKDGRQVEFFETLGDGLSARYAATGAAYPSTECFVDGIRCAAEEGRFGGVVIQAV